MILLNAKGKITLHNNKTNLIHRFDVPNGLKALKISFEYSPKTLENREKAIEEVKVCLEKYDEVFDGKPADYLPIKNLVTLSLDANGRYIGAAHRQSNKQEHIISADKSSVGFIKTEIEQGEWDIMLNVHSVSCDIDYKIIVEGEE
ncbi:MAG: hypothetical protein PUE60_02105 [Eubacteriales bacterium]|nr:hypothetical protein [Eubacteriales bacterium]